MINNNKPCGCGSSIISQKPIPTPILNNCANAKTPKIAHIEGKGDYKVQALVNTDDGEAFLPVTSTKAVFDECGNSLDNILKRLQDVLAEFNKTNTQFQDCNGNVHNLEMVLNCDVRVVDNFNTDSGAKALSARRGKILYDALTNQYSDLALEDVEDGTLAAKIKNSSDVRITITELQDKVNQYVEQCDVLFSLLSDLAKPTLITWAPELSSMHILRRSFTESGNLVYCPLGFEWSLNTPRRDEIISGITSAKAALKWYDADWNNLKEQVIGEPDVWYGSCDNPINLRVPIPDDATYCTIQVTVYYGELALTSNKVTYNFQDHYNVLQDFTLVGVDIIEGIDTVTTNWDSKLDPQEGLIYSHDIYGKQHVEDVTTMDTLYYSKTKMAELGKSEVDEEVPLYYFNANKVLTQYVDNLSEA